jgi:hypothetical protein
MGNRTMLSFGTCCDFEANNCLPVTWLALFEPHEFLVETRRFEYEQLKRQESAGPVKRFLEVIRRIIRPGDDKDLGSSAGVQTQNVLYEEAEVAVYKTLSVQALERVEAVIERLKGKTPIWAYLRPLEILREELRLCPQDGPVELDVTQLYWAKEPVYGQRVSEAASAFAQMLDSLTGDERGDLATLDQLVNDYNLFPTSTVADLDPETLAFTLFGTYWGEREDLYAMEYFDEAYWTADS